jgi:hypothetical protein
MTRGESNRSVRALACIVMLAFITPVVAADLPLKPATEAPPANTTQPAKSAGPFAAPSATCQEWTDGCRTCQRQPTGEAACSNVGIACVSKELKCTKP